MAKYFDENEKIIDILNRYPETVEFFVNKGFDKLKNEKDRDVIGKLSLNLILKTKGISIEGFSQMLDDFIELARNSADITLNQKTKRTKGVKVVGLLPCPVRVPLLEQFDAFVEKNETDIEYDLKAASHGLEWLKGTVRNVEDYNELADIYLSAGFDLFFDEKLMGKFKKAGVFKSGVKYDKFNSDFENDYMSLKDPSGDYSILAVVPAVFLVNKNELNGREEAEESLETRSSISARLIDNNDSPRRYSQAKAEPSSGSSRFIDNTDTSSRRYSQARAKS